MQPLTSLIPIDVQTALTRIQPYIHRTPILTSSLLNRWLGHEIYFKGEMFQKIGAFKARGALNHLLKLQEQRALPNHVAAFSSGNHAQAVAWACQMLHLPATIYLPHFTSTVKQQATRHYGAEVVIAPSRQAAEKMFKESVANKGYHPIPPYDDDMVIAGQGTSCLEALQQGLEPHAIFTPCGGGGLLSGTFLAKELVYPSAKVIGVEPEIANDAKRSYEAGKIFRLPDTPPTIADGVRTLSVSPRTFYFIQQVDEMIDVPEEEIIYWTQWIMHLLKATCEPTSALAIAGAVKWLKRQKTPQKVLVILSGGNLDSHTQYKLWSEDYLKEIPSLK